MRSREEQSVSFRPPAPRESPLQEGIWCATTTPPPSHVRKQGKEGPFHQSAWNIAIGTPFRSANSFSPTAPPAQGKAAGIAPPEYFPGCAQKVSRCPLRRASRIESFRW